MEGLIEILSDGTVVIRLHVQPGGSRNAVTGVHRGAVDGVAPDAFREAVGNALAASGVARRQP